MEDRFRKFIQKILKISLRLFFQRACRSRINYFEYVLTVAPPDWKYHTNFYHEYHRANYDGAQCRLRDVIKVRGQQA